MTSVEPVPVRRRSRPVAAALAAVAAALLVVKAVNSFGDQATSGAGTAATVAVAAMTVAAAVVAALGARGAPPLTAGALGATLLLELTVGTASPRLLALVPLAVAAGLLFVPPGGGTRQESSFRGAVPAGTGRARAVLAWLAIGLHMAAGLPYLVSGLVAPVYGVLVLWAVWGVLLWLVLRLAARRSPLAPLVPLAALGIWFVVLWLGGTLLGWAP